MRLPHFPGCDCLLTVRCFTDLETDDFYEDWALYQFGPEAASEISKLFQKLDGRLPRPSRWTNGPGNLYPDSRTWEEISKEYEFVNDFEKLRPRIKGTGNLERFDYWLNNFRYMRAAARLNCVWGRFNETMEKVKSVRNSKTKAALAKETVLPIYKEMLQIIESETRENNDWLKLPIIKSCNFAKRLGRFCKNRLSRCLT